MFGMSKHRIVDGKLKGQGFMMDRKIVGKTRDGKLIVNARLPVKLGKWGFTTTGMIGTGLLTGGSVKDSIKDSMFWSRPLRIIGEGKAAYEGAGMAKNMVFGT